MRKQREQASLADLIAVQYFTSDTFYNGLRAHAEKAFARRGRKRAVFAPAVKARPEDMIYIQKAFNRLQKEYPALDHVRLNKGFGASFAVAASLGFKRGQYGALVIGAKKNAPSGYAGIYFIAAKLRDGLTSSL